MPTVLPENRLAEIADLEKWYPQFGADFETARPGFRQCILDSTACLFECVETCRLLEAHVHATAHQLMRNKQATSGSGDGSKGGRVLAQSMGPVSRTYEGSGATGFAGSRNG